MERGQSLQRTRVDGQRRRADPGVGDVNEFVLLAEFFQRLDINIVDRLRRLGIEKDAADFDQVHEFRAVEGEAAVREKIKADLAQSLMDIDQQNRKINTELAYESPNPRIA